jgi:uncharacterized coiled-coil DUF342 family protein
VIGLASQIAIPQEVASLINVVSERWGYYFGKRAVQSELMKATTVERATVRALGQKISAKINEWMEKGEDTREEIRSLQGELAKARAVLKEKSTPFYQKMRPLNRALSYLDKTVIPKALEEVTGEKVTPRFQVSDYIVKAITKPKK